MTLFHGANSPPAYEENLDVDKIDATAEELGSVAATMATVRLIAEMKQARALGEDLWYPLIDWVAYHTTIMRMHASTWLWDAIPPRPLLTPLEMRVRVRWTVVSFHRAKFNSQQVVRWPFVKGLACWYHQWGVMWKDGTMMRTAGVQRIDYLAGESLFAAEAPPFEIAMLHMYSFWVDDSRSSGRHTSFGFIVMDEPPLREDTNDDMLPVPHAEDATPVRRGVDDAGVETFPVGRPTPITFTMGLRTNESIRVPCRSSVLTDDEDDDEDEDYAQMDAQLEQMRAQIERERAHPPAPTVDGPEVSLLNSIMAARMRAQIALVHQKAQAMEATSMPQLPFSSFHTMENINTDAMPLSPAKRVPRQFRVPDEFRGRPVVGVAVDFEVTGSFRLQCDVVFAGAFAVAATRADGTLAIIEEMSACFVQPLDRREGETWRDVWTRRGFDELCWKDVWSREENQRVLDELHAARELHVDDLGTAVRETVAGLEAALREAGCAFAWKTDCAPFDLAVVNDYCLEAGERDMGYYRAGGYGVEFHEYWPMFLGAVAVLRGRPVHTLVEADYEPLNARIKQLAAAAFPATHRPLDDARNILARFHYTHEVLAAEKLRGIGDAAFRT